MAAVFLVMRPNCSLALPRTVFIAPATRADVQLRYGKLLAATMTHSQFGYLLSGSAVQLLHTGAGEALGNEFYDVSAVTTRQSVARLVGPPPHHRPVGVRPA